MSAPVNLSLRKFEMSMMRPTHVIVVIGKRGSGKSVMVTDILYHWRNVPTGIVISATEKLNPTYSKIVPPACIYYKFSSEILARVKARQEAVVDLVNAEIAASPTGTATTNPHAFIVLDDCLHDASSWQKDENIKFCFFNGRHAKLGLILALQYSMGLGPSLRGNIDFAILFRELNDDNRRRLYVNYAGCFPNYDTFRDVLNATTESNECLVIANSAKSNKLTDCVFWYKSVIHGPFRTCAPSLWALGNGNQASNEYDPASFAARRRTGPVLNVVQKGR